MSSEIELVLRMDLVAIAIGYNVSRDIARPVLIQAVQEMKRRMDAQGEQLRVVAWTKPKVCAGRAKK